MSYIIPIGSISLAEQERRRSQAVIAGKKRLFKKNQVDDTDKAIDRHADYPFDFVPAATRAGLVGWLTMPLAVVGNAYSIFADNVPAALTPQVPNNQVWVFYGCDILTLGQPVTQLFFTTGNSLIRKSMFDLELLYAGQETSGYFTNPVVYDPQEICGATVRARVATGAAARIVLYTIVLEPDQVNVA
jgi:hypothetical protein